MKFSDIVDDSFCFVFFIFTDCYVIADPFDVQGPSFTIEPPHHLEFTNIVDNHVDCVAKGSPTPKIEWLHLDNTLVTTIPRVSFFFIISAHIHFRKCDIKLKLLWVWVARC